LIILAATLATAQSAPPRKDIPAIAKGANGAVVSIVMSDKDGQPISQGSGFVISKDGRVVTNYHVIRSGVSAIVKLPDGAFFAVEGVLAADKDRDIAIIKARGQGFHTLSLGDSSSVQVGDEVVAIGNPLSLESTVSNGIVSAIRAMDAEGGKFLQITTPISPGSSGGPLFNMEGRVVGITTMYLKGGENLNFAIPVDDVKHLLSSYERLGRSVWSVVGSFPNEAATVAIPPGAQIGEPPQQAVSAHDYYQQLYAAGGFFHTVNAVDSTGKPNVITGTKPDERYVCFNEDASSVVFFTFGALAYDAKYSQAYQKVSQGPTNINDEPWKTMQRIQQDAPYVDFVPDFLLGLMPPRSQEFFRGGGRALTANFYVKGVKSSTIEYHWDGKAWIHDEQPEEPNAVVRTDKIRRLSVEPATLRYIEMLTTITSVGADETKASDSQLELLSSGTCERIPTKR
jgi:Trypsin-like peptidase domain